MTDALFDSNKRLPVLDGMRYFYSKTDDCNFIPRIEITMADPIIIPYLQSAAEKAMARYRMFRLVVIHDEGKYYLVDNERPPIVHSDDGNRHTVGTEENNGHLTWIGAAGCKIIVEFFHGISDGHGMLPFLRMIVQTYCNLRYGSVYSQSGKCIENEPQRTDLECMDSLFFIDENQSPSPKKKSLPAAFQFPDKQLASGHECCTYSLKVDAQQFDSYMRHNASSRTAVFSLFMNHAITSCNTLEEAPIIAAVAADVRKIYGAEATLRDCSDMIPLWFDQKIQALSLPQQLMLSRHMIVDGMQPDVRLAFASDTKKNNILLEKRIPSLDGKKQFCKRLHQYFRNNYTYCISNMGNITFGNEADPYVNDFHIYFSINSYPIIIVIGQFQQQYIITYCTRLIDDPYVHEFQQMFLNEGISCTCEKMENFVETLVVF